MNEIRPVRSTGKISIFHALLRAQWENLCLSLGRHLLATRPRKTAAVLFAHHFTMYPEDLPLAAKFALTGHGHVKARHQQSGVRLPLYRLHGVHGLGTDDGDDDNGTGGCGRPANQQAGFRGVATKRQYIGRVVVTTTTTSSIDCLVCLVCLGA